MENIIKTVYSIWEEYLNEEPVSKHYGNISLITDCLTRSYFRIKAPNAGDISRSSYYLATGKLLHDFILRRLAAKFNAKFEVKLSYATKDIVLCGHADLVTDDFVLELKTVSRLPDKPAESHIEQLNAYMAMADKAYGYLLYVSRVDGSATCFEHVFNPNLWQNTIEKAKKLKKACELNTPPEPHKPKSWLSKSCVYCQYSEICPYAVVRGVTLDECFRANSF